MTMVMSGHHHQPDALSSSLSDHTTPSVPASQQRQRSSAEENNDPLLLDEMLEPESQSSSTSKRTAASTDSNELGGLDDSDDRLGDYLVDSLLAEKAKTSLSLNETTLTRNRNNNNNNNSSDCSLTRLAKDAAALEDNNDKQHLFEDNSSVHSRLSVKSCYDNNNIMMMDIAHGGQEQAWNTLDSVHSRASVSTSSNGVPGYTTGGSSMTDYGNASADFNDSCCSFASFGGDSSSDGLDMMSSNSELSQQRAAFTSLEAPSRPVRLIGPGSGMGSKAPSFRGIKRGVSYRGSALTLIEESNSLD